MEPGGRDIEELQRGAMLPDMTGGGEGDADSQGSDDTQVQTLSKENLQESIGR